MKIISLGLGIQSTAMYIMSSLGKIERADYAVFADPGAELPDTYNTGSSAQVPADIRSRYYGTIQVAAYWLSANQFRITTSAPFYGDVRWIVTS